MPTTNLFGGNTDESGSLTNFGDDTTNDGTGLDFSGVGNDTVTTGNGGEGTGLDFSGVGENSGGGGGGGNFDFLKNLDPSKVSEYLKGNMGLTALLGGSALAAMGAGTPKTTPTIYQGGIPNLVATRNMITAPPTGRRAGAGGVNYGGDVTYSLAPAGQKPWANLRGDSAFIADPSGQANVLKGTGGTDTQSMANKIGYNLPGGWDGFTPQQKIAWFNQNNVSVDQLRAAGVPQSDIDWMLQNGYGSAGATAKTTGTTTSNTGIDALANAQKTAQTQADTIGLKLPSDWSTYDAAKKIDWYNANNVKPSQLIAAGVDQGTIDWMQQHGYATESTQPVTGGVGTNLPPGADSGTKLSQNDIDFANAMKRIGIDNVFGNAGPAPDVMPQDAVYAPKQTTRSEDQMSAMDKTLQQPSQSAGLMSALKQGMTEDQYIGNIKSFLQNNATASDADIYDQMKQYGIGASDVARALGVDNSVIQDKLKALGVTNYAQGGMAKGRYLQGETDGMADEIPARIGHDQPAALSHGEFVVPADVVSHLGNGNSDAGAKKLYQMMDRIRMARTGNKEQGKQINPDKFMPGGLAKAYANGGNVKHFVTGGTTTLPANVTGTQAGLSNWAGDYTTNLMAQGQALANMPFQQYMGPLTAGPSALQNKVTQGLESLSFPGILGQSFTSAGAPPAYNPATMQSNLPGGIASEGGELPGAPGSTVQNSGQPGIQAPQSSMGGISQPSGIAASYMNPYLQNVLQPQLAELNRQSQINLQPSLAKLTQSGGYGGGRQAIMESEANRNLLNAQNTAIGTGYANAYDKAMQQFNTEQGQAKTLADMMAGQGATNRAIEAEGVAADKAQFEEARANPFKMVQFQQSLLSGMPINAMDYTMQDPSTLTKIAQGVNTVDEMLKVLYGVQPAKKVAGT